jgi:uncharacterized protein YdiU (UPF0061 family)
VQSPSLIFFNRTLASELGIDCDELLASEPELIFSGNSFEDDDKTIALAYAGHQFGNFVPQLGDGRAILLGELLHSDGHRRDIQLKGAGRTVYSRRGDGRSALGPVIREYIMSEAMHALGIPTTRALAAIATAEVVQRESALPAGVFTRVASSHIRIGTFEYLSAREDIDGLRALTNYSIKRHYPEVAETQHAELEFLNSVVSRQARLVALWMSVGFIHGVMNTDNTSISGETIDYGPCAFMDTFHPATVFSYIDRNGRYAYANQAPIAQWNLARLAEALLPLLDPIPEKALEMANASVSRFQELFQEEWISLMGRKFGFADASLDDIAIMEEFLELLQTQQVDYTNAFRSLYLSYRNPEDSDTLNSLFSDSSSLQVWHSKWRKRLDREKNVPDGNYERMRVSNPAFIPRNHLVEEAIEAGVKHADYSVARDLMEVLSTPYTEQASKQRYTRAPDEGQIVKYTYCGT